MYLFKTLRRPMVVEVYPSALRNDRGSGPQEPARSRGASPSCSEGARGGAGVAKGHPGSPSGGRVPVSVAARTR